MTSPDVRGITVETDAPHGRFARGPVFTLSVSIMLSTVYNSPALNLPRGTVESAIALLPAVGIALSYRTLAQRRVPTSAAVLAIAYAVVVVTSSLLYKGPDTSLAIAISPAVTAVVLTLTGSLIRTPELLALGRVLIFAAILQSFLAIAEVQLKTPWAIELAATPKVGYIVRSNLVMDGYLRASGTMGHPILLGVICTVALIFALVPGVIRRWPVRLALIALLLWGVLLSGSRSSLVAVALALIVYFGHRNSPLRRGARMLLLVALIPLALYFFVTTLETAEEVSPFSLSNRVDALGRFTDTISRPVAIALFGENRGFQLETVADNQYLTTLGTYGILGLLILVAAIAYAVSSPSPLLSAIAATIAFLFLSFDVLGFDFTELLMWLVIGASHAEGRHTAMAPAEPSGLALNLTDVAPLSSSR